MPYQFYPTNSIGAPMPWKELVTLTISEKVND